MVDPLTLPIALYAAQTLGLVAPYLTEIAKGAAAKVGEVAVEHLPALWARVRGRLVDRAPASLRRFEEHPSDSRYRGALEVELEEAFKDDPHWMAEIVALVEAATAGSGATQSASQTGSGNVTVQVAGNDNQVRTHGGTRTP